MFQATAVKPNDKPGFYRALDQQLGGLLTGERGFISNAANFSALIFQMLPELNWAGFYVMRGNDLLLGPFQGKPACVRIPVHPAPRGVCVRRRLNARRSWWQTSTIFLDISPVIPHPIRKSLCR